MNKNNPSQLIVVESRSQQVLCYEDNKLECSYRCSTAKNGLGEQEGSGCTPRGWHCVHNIIGEDARMNSVFIGRVWTGEIYSPELSATHPERDWILTRIIQIQGMEPSKNRGGAVDSLKRYIYFHGAPDEIKMGKPASKGCIRMQNKDMIELADWVHIGTLVYIK